MTVVLHWVDVHGIKSVSQDWCLWISWDNAFDGTFKGNHIILFFTHKSDKTNASQMHVPK